MGFTPSQQYCPTIFGENGILRKTKTMLSVNCKLENGNILCERGSWPSFDNCISQQIFYSKVLHLKPLLRQKGVAKYLNICQQISIWVFHCVSN